MNVFSKVFLCAWICFGAVSPVFAQEVPAKKLQRAEALGASTALVFGARQRASQADTSTRDHLALQAAIEAQLGLELYRLGEDWRAVSALQRYQLLARTRESAYLGSLMIGQIYDRNARASLAALNFEQATLAAPAFDARVWTTLLETQQVCVRQDYWANCNQRLEDLHELTIDRLPAPLSEVLYVQRAVASVVLNRALPALPAGVTLSSPFEAHVRALGAERARFDDLPLRRPWLAGGLSAVLPGAGQLYNRQWGDALIAFTLNAVFASATYYSLRELESVPLGVGSALLFSGFYVGNIVNARTDATRHNAEVYEAYYESIKRTHWPTVSFEVQDNEVTFVGGFMP